MTLAKIVYASMTGNTEGISEILEEKLKAAGLDVERIEADDADSDVFEDADIAIVATYTYGDGEVPDELEDFHDDLSDEDLAGKIYGVVGSGDEEMYPDAFCKAADLFEEAFEATGAKKGSATVKINNDAEDEDVENLQKFVDEIAKA
ncbi:flavodoxin [Loigolactobacillus bifermentans]|jgi:flavodoxin short chain|nr:flavodoxin [Loigolactobacillus bifermentans]QGG59849.1 flavodoxin [Loigolactobacillus bifermentans]